MKYTSILLAIVSALLSLYQYFHQRKRAVNARIIPEKTHMRIGEKVTLKLVGSDASGADTDFDPGTTGTWPELDPSIGTIVPDQVNGLTAVFTPAKTGVDVVEGDVTVAGVLKKPTIAIPVTPGVAVDARIVIDPGSLPPPQLQK